MNPISVDVEEWFHVCGAVPQSRWSGLAHRARSSVERLLEILGATRATFFILGYVAGREPGLVREIAAAGHEIGSHGWGHERVDRLTPSAFRDDVRRSLDAIGVRCAGYRGPEWSMTPWAREILAEEGFEYSSSSIDPFARPRRIGPLWEIPVRVNGTMLRVLPGALLAPPIALHPYDIDPGFPRIPLPWSKGLLRYVGRDRAEARLRYFMTRRPSQTPATPRSRFAATLTSAIPGRPERSSASVS